MRSGEKSRHLNDLPKKLLIGLLWTLSLGGCASGYCREPRLKHGETPQSVAAAQATKNKAVTGTSEAGTAKSVGSGGGAKGAADSNKDSKSNSSEVSKVLVYKYDGSQQCGMGDAISIDKMAQELKGIKIYSQEKKRDGLMHIQVCGSITGKANVYEISKDDLVKAQNRKFKLWEF